jgi:PPOX class probable F420-dependent enzyme
MHDRAMDGVWIPTTEVRFVADARTASLATIAPDGRPRLVPICFALIAGEGGRPVLVSPIDEKPKASDDPLGLARVRDILARPSVTLLVDRWSEDWTRLGWVRLEAQAAVLDPEARDHPAAVGALRAKYPQYAAHGLDDRPILRFAIERVVSWGDLGPDRGPGTGPGHAVGDSGSSSSPGGSHRR